jgi:hypothetical protein
VRIPLCDADFRLDGGALFRTVPNPLREQRAYTREASGREYLIFFEHDPEVAAGFIREASGRRDGEAVEIACGQPF